VGRLRAAEIHEPVAECRAAVLADLVDAHELANVGPLPARTPPAKSVREKRRMVAISSVATESFEAAQGLVPNRGDEHHAAAVEAKSWRNGAQKLQ
jgi:hypothetical protein